jgi:hypothetical protein
MDHRWGWRLRVDLTARVGDAAGEMRAARLRDVSVSGAFLETAARPVAFTCIDVELRTHRGGCSRALAAHVVRTTPEGIGVEWDEFAPTTVSRLMETYPAHAQSEPSIELATGREPAPSRGALVLIG